MRFSLFVICGIVVATSASLAQVDTKAPRTDSRVASNTQEAATDSSFMKALAQGGMAEVDAGKLASEKASDPAVKKFGQQMVMDHTKNNEQLKALAQTSGVALPPTIDRKDAEQQSKLENDSGPKFDVDYMRDQVQDHQKTVQLLEHEIQDGQDPAVRQFAQETLPVVSHHLTMAKQLQGKLASAGQGSSQ